MFWRAVVWITELQSLSLIPHVNTAALYFNNLAVFPNLNDYHNVLLYFLGIVLLTVT